MLNTNITTIKKTVAAAIAIIFLLAILSVAGYYIYTNYFSGDNRPASSNVAIKNGPKEAYLKFLDKVTETKSLEQLMDIIVQNSYFPPETDGGIVSSSLFSEMQDLSLEEKTKQFLELKKRILLRFNDAPNFTETVSGNNAVVSGQTSREGVISVLLVKEDGVWKIERY